MLRPARWLRVALVSAVVFLLLGRWLAVRTIDVHWADALGVGDAHRAIANLSVMLAALAFTAAAAWCIGNLYLVYRSIGSVQVPRRLGNLEIVETVPRRYLLVGAVTVGLVLAFAVSYGAADWWSLRALLDARQQVGLRDPVLDRDAAYYLFQLPWQRTIHGFALLLAGMMLAVTLFLYTAVGAIHWTKTRVEVTDIARTHVGALFVAFALVLFWGYRLEPAEFVSGIERVPFDAILTEIRIPASRVLSGVAIVVAGASAIWIWVGHFSLIGVAWVSMALASFVGHYVAPAFTAASRSVEERADSTLDAWVVRFVRGAYGISSDTATAPLAIPDPEFIRRRESQLARLPLWDAFAVTMILNQVSQPRSFDRFFDATLGVFGDEDEAVGLYLAVREVNRAAAAEGERGMSWKRRHGAPYAWASGVVAVHASRVSDERLPEFVPDLTQPDSTIDEWVDLPLERSDVWFAPATTDFAIASPEDGPFAALRAGGLLHRVVLAWVLQSPSLALSADVGPETLVLSDRAVGGRLARYAPFARFGAAYPVIADGTLLWAAAGYVSSETYPLSAPVEWRGRVVRYLRAGIVGVVNAQSGETAVYLLPDADPLSRAWATLASDIVQPVAAVPPAVLRALRYPDELFRAQLDLLRRTDWRPGNEGGVARVPEPYWWVGPAVADSVTRLRLRAVVEVQLEPRVAAIVEGTVVDGAPQLQVTAYPEPLTLPGPSELVQEFVGGVSEEAAIPGPLKLAAFEDGAIGVQAFYAGPDANGGPPRLAEVAVGWRGAVGHGSTLPAALRRVQVARPAPDATPGRWADAREWFERLDAARAAADWTAFGEAWAALRQILIQRGDSAP